jgi:mRNA interferase MazF
MRRGQIYTANLNPNRGAEIGKVRPVLVMQADWLSAVPTTNTVVILPLTSQLRPNANALRPLIKARDGLRHDSQVVVEMPRTLDRNRLGHGPLTTLSHAEMKAVERSLLTVLGFVAM